MASVKDFSALLSRTQCLILLYKKHQLLANIEDRPHSDGEWQFFILFFLCFLQVWFLSLNIILGCIMKDIIFLILFITLKVMSKVFMGISLWLFFSKYLPNLPWFSNVKCLQTLYITVSFHCWIFKLLELY